MTPFLLGFYNKDDFSLLHINLTAQINQRG